MGSGKSTVSDGFAERGAVVLDADEIVHDLQRPGQPILIGMVAILGEEILTEEGTLDRKEAGRRMFADEASVGQVNSLIHPLVWSKIREDIILVDADSIVVVDAPLLFETLPDNMKLDASIVVDAPIEVAVERLVRYRAVSEDDARSRIGTQMPRAERLVRADYVITNNGTKDELEPKINAAWGWMHSLFLDSKV